MHSPMQVIERLLPQLSSTEKSSLLQRIVQDISATPLGIEKTPGVCGGAARVVRTRIPVWVLVQSRRLGLEEMELRAAYPTLRTEDLDNAWRYARLFTAEIERAIRENEDA